VLQEIADKHRRSISQVVISWALQLGAVVIPRASSEEHILDNAALIQFDENGAAVGLGVFLDAHDLAAIHALDGTLGDL
jgi:diketogulonate reductase-like aldo/keto reductase